MPVLESRAGAPVKARVFDFSGGKNSKAAKTLLSGGPYSLRPNEMIECEDFDFTESGGLVKRRGYVKINSVALVPVSGTTEVHSMYELRQRNGSRFLLVVCGNTVYKLNTAGTGFDQLGTFGTPDKRTSFCTLADLAIMFNGVDAPKKYAGGASIADLGGTPPVGSVCSAYRNRVYVGGVSGSELTLYYCALGAPEDWSTPNNAGSIPVPATRSHKITALLPFYNRLLIFCDNEVFQLTGTGPSDFTIHAISYYVGALHFNCVAPAGNDVYFASVKGIHSLSTTEAQSIFGDTREQYASAKIEPDFLALPLNLASQFSLINSRRDNSIHLHVPNSSGGVNARAFVGDYYHLDHAGRPAWRDYTNQPFSSGVEAELTNGVIEHVHGGYNGFVYKHADTDTDDGVAISGKMIYVTEYGAPEWSKTFRHLQLFTNDVDATLLVTDSYDFGLRGGTTRLVGLTSGGGDKIGTTFMIGVSKLINVEVQQKWVKMPNHGRYVSYTFANSEAKRVKLYGFIGYAFLRRELTP